MKKLRSSLPMIALVIGVVAASAFKPADKGRAAENFYWFAIAPGGGLEPSTGKPPYGPDNPFGCTTGNTLCSIGSTGFIEEDNDESYPTDESARTYRK